MLSDTVELKQIQFLDRDTGFVAGNIIILFPYFQARQTLLLRTVDGGHTWERLDSSFSKYFSFGNFQFLNPQTGWISINNGGQVNWEDRKGLLLKTTNGGSTWATLKEDSLPLCGAFYFNNEEQGYSFWASFFDNFGPSYLYCTTDEGKNWNYTGIIDNDLVKKVECHSPSVLWAIGFKTSLSINDGKDWRSWDWFTAIDSQKRTIPADFDINNSRTLFLIGNAMTSASDVEGRLLITSDAGENWSLNLQMFYTAFFGISVVGNKAWIVGSNGLILHNDDVITNVEKEQNESVKGFYLEQNFPNPFNPSTTINYQIKQDGLVTLSIYDILGAEVKTLVNEEKTTGRYSYNFDGSDLATGVYIYQLKVNDFVSSKKLVLLK
ncbi:MAG: T9SS type A sorting domain-containing protein [Ignavibacteriaceae bacterium]|nr:T9SS type A sorting domain-containing protein [Ignavibacteriaceae bacterium]